MEPTSKGSNDAASGMIRFAKTGGPEVLEWIDCHLEPPGAGMVQVRHEAVGVNFIDIYHRKGTYYYQLPLPSGLGLEGAGVITAVGAGVTDLKIGDRVAYAGGPPGAYSTERLIPADRVLILPEKILSDTAAALLVKGLTVQLLVRSIYRVQPGDTVLVHAAAGGVGLIACRWLKHLGATVIGTVSSDEKAALANSHGCDFPIVYTRENFVERVLALTGGHGVSVVYDAVGKDTWRGSLDCLKPFGVYASFGFASGPVPAFDLDLLRPKSLFASRPSINSYITKRLNLLRAAEEVFALIGSGVIAAQIGNRYRLCDAAQAHQDLESRRTTGSLILEP